MAEFKHGTILPVDITDEIQKSYLSYAMAVIVGRALPDVRDGLKPAHRRILFAMYKMGLTPDKPYAKSARTVGEVLGKYHPHGDTVVYGTMVRMAQDFSMRYPLIDGHGNFGSIDGDSAAAMRYTESRMTPLSLKLLEDIDKNTVDFQPNFDDELEEPVVLPSRYPNLLVNGSSGIAVGMATNIPPHNLGEIINGCVAYIDNPEITVKELMKHVPGPDFPTGGFIMGKDQIKQAYETGRGVITLRSKTHMEAMTSGKSRIVVTELPYNVNKATLIERIAQLVREKKVDGITDLRDESDREGIRVVIELRRDVDANVVLNQLFKNSQLQQSFGIILLALYNNQPIVMNLKDMIAYYIGHQKDVVTRRTQFLLDKANARAHILEGYRIALDNIDAIIKLIRASETVDEARDGLMKNFDLTEIQAKAILDMRLQRLTGLERDKIEEEYRELLKEISRLEAILGSESLLMQVIKEEIKEIGEKYGDKRRTTILASDGNLETIDLIAEEDVVVTITHQGYIKRQPLVEYSSQRRGGRGKAGVRQTDTDFVEQIFICNTHQDLLIFTDAGIMYVLPVFKVPEAGKRSRGVLIHNITSISRKEEIRATIPAKEDSEDLYMVTVTKKGYIKKTRSSEYANMRSTGLIALKLEEDDELISVGISDGKADILLGTSGGKAIRFNEDQVRPMGRATRGVSAVKLDDGESVIGMEIVDAEATVLSITSNGYGKRTLTSEFKAQNRNGKGVIMMRMTKETGDLVGFRIVDDGSDIMMITENGIIIRVSVDEIPKYGRNTRGVRVQKLEEGDSIKAIASFILDEE